MKNDIKIYISGPYTLGDPTENVKKAITVGDIILQMKFYPYIPHLTHFWNVIYPKPWEDWITLDLVFLEACQGLFRIEGESLGAIIEESRAHELKIPVFYVLEELLIYDWRTP